MIELHLQTTIFTFDGRITEAFPQGQVSSRYHVVNNTTANVKSDKNGRQSLQIFMKGGGFATGQLLPDAAQQADMVVAEIKK